MAAVGLPASEVSELLEDWKQQPCKQQQAVDTEVADPRTGQQQPLHGLLQQVVVVAVLEAAHQVDLQAATKKPGSSTADDVAAPAAPSTPVATDGSSFMPSAQQLQDAVDSLQPQLKLATEIMMAEADGSPQQRADAAAVVLIAHVGGVTGKALRARAAASSGAGAFELAAAAVMAACNNRTTKGEKVRGGGRAGPLWCVWVLGCVGRVDWGVGGRRGWVQSGVCHTLAHLAGHGAFASAIHQIAPCPATVCTHTVPVPRGARTSVQPPACTLQAQGSFGCHRAGAPFQPSGQARTAHNQPGLAWPGPPPHAASSVLPAPPAPPHLRYGPQDALIAKFRREQRGKMGGAPSTLAEMGGASGTSGPPTRPVPRAGAASAPAWAAAAAPVAQMQAAAAPRAAAGPGVVALGQLALLSEDLVNKVVIKAAKAAIQADGAGLQLPPVLRLMAGGYPGAAAEQIIAARKVMYCAMQRALLLVMELSTLASSGGEIIQGGAWRLFCEAVGVMRGTATAPLA